MTGTIDVHLGRRVRELRKQRRWTQADLGSFVGMRFQQIQKYETAENKMSAAVLWRLATALGVDVQHLFDDFAAEPVIAAEPRSFAESAGFARPREGATPLRSDAGIPDRLNAIASS